MHSLRNYYRESTQFRIILRQITYISVYASADIGASNLKKGLFFSPDPYVKFRISPCSPSTASAHHGQHCRTEVRRNTVDPIWDRNVST
jgi:hypothetical protein